ncbi:uncharacterized protein N7482_001956 [Penicillium canariense]|uniref:Zn(2)-C6 fungal-type domain-containing protein n=1 Tax=Penicillium canariense TaxID=189055 RepID=A0A9W9IEE5_9EURO|nr:uncharacterized protein N7482_001956 [Penicillium canariense]KAJ5176079.1 hypothetical protein N7482_001956 [Penicillium canariense]
MTVVGLNNQRDIRMAGGQLSEDRARSEREVEERQFPPGPSFKSGDDGHVRFNTAGNRPPRSYQSGSSVHSSYTRGSGYGSGIPSAFRSNDIFRENRKQGYSSTGSEGRSTEYSYPSSTQPTDAEPFSDKESDRDKNNGGTKLGSPDHLEDFYTYHTEYVQARSHKNGCWVPFCKFGPLNSEVLNAHLKLHGKRGGKVRYVATLIANSTHYDPKFQGHLTSMGNPIYERASDIPKHEGSAPKDVSKKFSQSKAASVDEQWEVIPRLIKKHPRVQTSWCITCQRRKTKCDKTHPTCKKCWEDNFACEGYRLQISQGSWKTASRPFSQATVSAESAKFTAGPSERSSKSSALNTLESLMEGNRRRMLRLGMKDDEPPPIPSRTSTTFQPPEIAFPRPHGRVNDPILSWIPVIRRSHGDFEHSERNNHSI